MFTYHKRIHHVFRAYGILYESSLLPIVGHLIEYRLLLLFL